MDRIETVPESPPEFREIDDLLKCGVCHETLQIPVLTPCSHSYCSVCIRKWLATKQVCPTCSVDVFESSLRKNPLVANIIEALQTLKMRRTSNKSVKCLQYSSPSTSKATTSVASTDVYVESASKLNRKLSPVTPTNRHMKKKGLPPTTSKTRLLLEPIGSSESEDSSIDDFKPTFLKRQPSVPKEQLEVLSSVTSTPKISSPNRAPCPVCKVIFPVKVIEGGHLDKCLGVEPAVATRASESRCIGFNRPDRPAPAFSPSSSSVNKTATNGSFLAESVSQTLEPIKKMVYNLMSDAQLKKELRKYGLQAQGDRKTLTSRLKRWVIIYNAECDSSHHRSIEELRKQFDKDERALSSTSTSSSLTHLFKTVQPDSAEFDVVRKEYIKNNEDSFKNLVTQIKSRQMPKLSSQQVTLGVTKSSPTSSKVLEDRLKVHIKEDIINSEETKLCADDNGIGNIQTISDSEEELSKCIKKNFKRKVYISSESETDCERRSLKKALVKRSISPVLTLSKASSQRQLRSRPQASGDKTKPSRPQRRKTRKKEVSGEPTRMLQSSNEVTNSPAASISHGHKQVDERCTPDLFDSFEDSRSDEIPCGQTSKQENKEENLASGDDLSQLITLMEEQDNGSSTDFE